MERVKELLKDNHSLVFSKDSFGRTAFALCGGRGPKGGGGTAAGRQGRGRCQEQPRRDAVARGGAHWQQACGGIAAGQRGRGGCQGRRWRDAVARGGVERPQGVAQLLLANQRTPMPETTTALRLCTWRRGRAARTWRNCCAAAAATNSLDGGPAMVRGSLRCTMPRREAIERPRSRRLTGWQSGCGPDEIRGSRGESGGRQQSCAFACVATAHGERAPAWPQCAITSRMAQTWMKSR